MPEVPGAGRADLEAYDVAQAVYDDDRLEGSAAKAFRGSLHWSALGADVLSTPGWVRRGYVPVGVSPGKRGFLASAACRAAALPKVTPKLISSLVGSFGAAFGYRRPLFGVLRTLYQVVDDGEERLFELSEGQRDELLLCALLAPLAENSAVCRPLA